MEKFDLISSATAEECRVIEKLLVKRKRELAKPRQVNLDKVLERIDWHELSRDYAIDWQKAVFIQFKNDAITNFNQLYDDLVGEQDLTVLAAVKKVTKCFQDLLSIKMNEELQRIKAGLPKSNIALVYNEETYKYEVKYTST